ncbi:hypothetical protein QOZ80_3AG0219700 [Eleusine coracana subsp. coracana]|nr:hypothetical protein QOZ80_3AG0219700 [Eleusine coracana subsp. coracana]
MTSSSMDAKVIVSTYKELPPRRRHSNSHGASTRAPRTSSSSMTRQFAGGGYNRRALLLAYARQLRQRRVMELQQRVPPLLEWGEWKTDPAAVSSGGDVIVAARRRWGSRVRTCVRIWIRTFRRRVRRIRENASCKNGDETARC